MASEGGDSFPWKIKKLLKLTEPPPRSRESLPASPEGMEWIQGSRTKSWRLVKASLEPELVTEDKQRAAPVSPDEPKKTVDRQRPPRSSAPPPPVDVVDRLPAEVSEEEEEAKEEDWEFLSDRLSNCSNGVIVRTSGSVRSITSMEGNLSADNSSGHNTTLSIPFKIQRTASSSTIDSSDGALGPAGKGVLGVDYVEHVILPSDTLQGICLHYKVSSTRLRQANHFSGNSLMLAPKKLVIPISKKALRSGYIRVQDTDAKEYKLHAMLYEFPDLCMTEALAYLELADWVLQEAIIRSAQDDGEWERDMDRCSLRSGEIRITPTLKHGVPIGFDTKGAGIQPVVIINKKKPQVTLFKDVPAIATKTVKAQDVYQAAHQHNIFGVELQSIEKKHERN